MTIVRLATVAIATGLAASASASVGAGTIQTYDVAPGQLAGGKTGFSAPHGMGTNPFAYDWDSAAPAGVAAGAGGATDGAFYADVQNSGASQSDRYRTFRLGVNDLAGISGGTLSLSELTGISYQTSKPGAASAIDWRISIYTTATDGDNDGTVESGADGNAATWYRTRIQSFPNEALNLNAPSNQWNTWTNASGAANELVWEGNNGLGGNHDWASLLADIGNEEIMMIDFTLGANSGGGTGASSLDNIRLDFSNGNGVVVNLVPEPASLALLAIGGGVAMLRRSRKA